MSKKSEEPSEPILLTTGSIISGKYYAPGEPIPFKTASEVPENLRPLIAGDEAEIPEPVVRDIYSPALRGQAQRIRGNVAWQDFAEEHAVEPLREDVREVLEDAHNFRIARLKAQAAVNQGLTDSTYAVAAAEAEAKVAKFFVKRGAVFSDARKVQVKPAENVYVLRPNKEYECIGAVDSEGQLPPEEILP